MRTDNTSKLAMLRAIFFAEFDNVVGPRIAFQSPEGFVSPDVFDAVSEYVITKPQIAGKLITICAFGIKILCLPVCLEKAKYARNALLFNAGFVFAEDAEVEHYEPLVRKLALVLCALETESEFLSRPESKQTLRSILPRLHEQLCEQGECSVPVDAANTISLKLFSPLPPPSEVKEHQVPVPVFDLRRLVTKDWDLTLQQIVPFVDGINYVKRIAREADVEVGVACKCIQQLVYYGCVRVVDIFQFSNVYAVQPEVHQLWHDPALQREVCMLCSKSTAQSFSSQFRGRSVSSGATQSLFHKIMAVLCAMQPGVTLHDICVQHDVYAWGIDIRRLCVLGVIKGFLRRVHFYPLRLPVDERDHGDQHFSAGGSTSVNFSENGSQGNGPEVQNGLLAAVERLSDGSHIDDEICCELGTSMVELNAKCTAALNLVFLCR